jgi:hypothetical protein
MDTTSVDAPGLGAASPRTSRAQRSRSITRRFLLWLLLPLTGSLVLTACGGGGGGGGGSSPPSTYSVIANVSGLSGSNLVLSLGDGTNVPISSNGQVTLVSGLANGASYSVSVTSSPVNPSETCTISDGSGTVNDSTVNIPVSCTTANTPQASTEMAADPAVPAAITSSITNVVTASGSGALGSWIPVNLATQSGDTIALCLDADGHAVMASMVTSDQTTFSSASTALALVRLTIADVPTTENAAAINAAVQGTPAYATLVSLINADLSAGVRPLSDAAVAQNILVVAESVVPTISAATNKARAKAQSLGPATNLPFTILPSDDPNVAPYLQITGASNGSIAVYNNMPIPWSGSTSALTSGGTATTPLAGPSPLSPDQTLQLKMNNAPFNLLIAQDEASATQIAEDMVAGTFEQALAVVPGLGSCAVETLKGIVQAKIGPTVRGSIQSGLTWSAFANALPKDITADTALAVLTECGPKVVQQLGPGVAVLVEAIIGVDAELLASLVAVKSLVGATGWAIEADYANRFWGQTFPVVICAAADYTIHSCVASFTFDPTSLLMAPGAVGQAVVAGIDSNSSATPLPGDLTFIPDDDTIATAVGMAGVTVTAATTIPLSPSVTNVVVTDPATGANSPLPITVVWPTLVPSANPITVTTSDQTLVVSLTGPNGAATPSIVLPSNITWSTTAPTATIQPVTSVGSTSTWTIPANATANPVQITATDPNGNDYPPLTVTVQGASFVLDPASVNVGLTLSDLGPDGAGGLASGPGYGSQACAAPCANFTSSGGSYGATVAFTDVWGLESGTWTFSSSLQGNVAITAGATASFTANANWSAPAGPFQGGFSGGFSFTIGQPYSVSVTTTCTESSSVTNPCDGSLPAGKILTSLGITVPPQSSAPGSVQYALAAGSYIFTWGIVGGTDPSCCLGAPDQGTGPTATAALSLSAAFQPSQ